MTERVVTEPSALDERMMDVALEAAERGHTAPNPHVGAVIARGEEIIAVGHHERAGEPHAEIAALRAAGDRAQGATLYCTLEPCNHHGRTPPCTDAIVAAGIARVVVGCVDPKKHGPTSGIARLRERGIEVVVGVREERAIETIADFTSLVERGRPLVVLKAAITLDGRISTRTGDSRWITGEPARAEAHRLRDRADAIMVGVGTVLADDPRLDVRTIEGTDPIRVVLDSMLRTPATARVVRHSSRRPTWIVHGPDAPADRREELAGSDGLELIEAPRANGGGLDLGAVLSMLGKREVMRLLVEGGARIHGALLEAGLADRAEIFVAPIVLGDRDAKGLAELSSPPARIADALRLTRLVHRRVGDDLWVRGMIDARRPR